MRYETFVMIILIFIPLLPGSCNKDVMTRALALLKTTASSNEIINIGTCFIKKQIS